MYFEVGVSWWDKVVVTAPNLLDYFLVFVECHEVCANEALFFFIRIEVFDESSFIFDEVFPSVLFFHGLFDIVSAYVEF